MKSIFLTLFIVLLFLELCGQTTLSEKSKDKVIIGGKTYLVHIVDEGDSLYNLSKLYNVSQREIARENPEVFMGLRVGQALKIPCKEVADEKQKREDVDKYIFHTVKPKETLYSLSKRYDIKKSDIVEANPGADKVIKIGQVLKIPVIENVEEPLFDADEDLTERDKKDTTDLAKFYLYKVKRKDTYYSLTREYDVSQEELIELNPVLKDGLKYGLVIKIPREVRDSIPDFVFYQADTTALTDLRLMKRVVPYSAQQYYPCPQKQVYTKRFNVALMLPFFLDENSKDFYIDSSEYNDDGHKIYKRVYYSREYIYPRSLNYIKFYEGFLIALNEMKNQGFSVNLSVFDTTSDSTDLQEVLQRPGMEDLDLIVGPIYPYNLELVSEFSKVYDIPLVSPFSINLTHLKTNENFFQVFPSFDAQLEKLAHYTSKRSKDNIVVLHDGDSLYAEKIQSFKIKLFSNIDEDTLLEDISYKEVVFKDSINIIKHALKEDQQNVLIVPTNNEAFVTDVITRLNTLYKLYGYSIELYGMSRWSKFQNIDPEYYFNLQLKTVSPFFVDYQEDNVIKFIKIYRELYKTEPSQYSFHGYDVGFFFLSSLLHYGSDFHLCVNTYHPELLQARYKFVKWKKESGYENIYIDLIKYNSDYTINKEHFEKNEKGYFVKLDDDNNLF